MGYRKFIMALKYCIIFTFLFAPFLILESFVQPAYSSDYKQFRIERCKARMNNDGNWQKKHYAFAISEDGSRCAWSFNWEKKKYAIHRALRDCKHRAKADCRLVYAK